MVTRRDALKTIGGLAGAAGLSRLLSGCGDNKGPEGITTIVYMMMENRSYDHVLGSRGFLEQKPGDGLVQTMTNPDTTGAPVALWVPQGLELCDLDPPHDWVSAHNAWDMGMNDGFVLAHQAQYTTATGPQAIEPMQYLTRNEMPVSWALADNYTTCDRWFSSVMGPTWPNRFYWHMGTSGGVMTNTLPSTLSGPSVYSLLEAKNINWAYYYGNIPVVSIIQGIDLTNKIFRFDQFMEDAANGVLPPVVYLDPAFYENDDHPPIHPINGQELISTVYTALSTSPQWKNCLLVITYDENGGFFDHVSPPQTADDYAAQGFNQMGFRVPAMVIGPYAKQGYVSSVVYDHTSAIKHLQNTFDLDPLTMRSTAANDLTDCIDMDRLAAGDWSPPADIPTVDVSAWPMDSTCQMSSSAVAPPGSHDILDWANAHPELIAGYDLRSETPQYRANIRKYLANARKRGLVR